MAQLVFGMGMSHSTMVTLDDSLWGEWAAQDSTFGILYDAEARPLFASLREGSEEQLRAIPAKLLKAGSSEIRNWITVAAACKDLKLVWDEYIPVYRTLAGTGCGLGFACWS